MKGLFPILLAAALLVPPTAHGQERPVRWQLASAAAQRVAQGATFRVTLRATIDTGWKLYSLDPQKGGPIATTIALGDTSDFRIAKIDAPKAEEYPDRNFNIFTWIYTDSSRFGLSIRAAADARPGRHTLPVTVLFQTCTDRYCLPARTDTLILAVRVSEALSASSVNSADSALAVQRNAMPAADSAVAVPRNAMPAATPIAMGTPGDIASMVRFVWLALTMGLLSLLTPCILPMIPITVSYFGGAGEQSRRTRSVAALAHALGIVGVFTLLGFAIATIFGAGGIVRLAASPWLNLVIAALFIAFALNLLGLFEITLPQRLLARASTVGTSGDRHAAGALLMGGAFAVTSFTCTVPFVGTLLVLATQGSWRWPLIGLAAYGAAFALPFFLLALSPRLLERLPRSGDWMLTLKRSLAVAEIALAVKFLSNVDLVLGANLLTRDVVIIVWIFAAFAIAGLAASRLFPPSTKSSIRVDSSDSSPFGGSAVTAPPRRAIPALAVALTAIAFATWLGSGLRGERLGELEAYLPPLTDASGAHVFQAGGGELPWMLNAYDSALVVARAENKPVLVDFTGYTCTNCRWMEANMFPRADVVPHLERFVRVRLYTDGIGEPYLSQQRLQFERFGTIALPYYVVLDPTGASRATFLGMTRDSKEFTRFLEHAFSSDSSGGSQ